MSTTLVLIVLGGLLAASLFMVSQWKRYRIRHTGTLVTATVTQIQMWQDASRADYSLQSKMTPFLGGGGSYEIRAEWTDPQTGESSMFMSGVKYGLPTNQRGDHRAAYISPYRKYLKLSEPLLSGEPKLFPQTT